MPKILNPISPDSEVQIMGKGLILGLDVGTTETKAILIDECGNVISEKSRELPLIYTREGWIEQDIEELWVETATVIRRCVGRDSLSSLTCIAVTGQRETLCPFDKDFTPLRNAISWQDTRGWKICKRMIQELGYGEVYSITGLPINTMPWASKIAWLRENDSPAYEKTWKFVGVVDYIVWKLCGVLKIDYSNACRTMLFDLSKLKWSEKICEYIGLDLDKVPELMPSGQILGAITKEASEETGLPKGMTVVYGGGDQQCNALGVGITDPKRISCVLGTCTNIEGYSEKPPLDSKMRLQAQLHVVPNRYLCEGGIASSGSIYKWFRDNFGEVESLFAKRTSINPYTILDTEAKSAPPGAMGLIMIPYFAGSLYPYWNSEDRGLFLGLRLGHKKEHFVRAILEGVAYEYNRMVKDAQRVLATNLEKIRFMGGGARSDIWPQIITDVTGMRGMTTKCVQAGAMGAAILGSVACGWFADVRRAAEILVRPDRAFDANETNHGIYLKYYDIYEKIYDRIQDLINDLSRLEEERAS